MQGAPRGEAPVPWLQILALGGSDRQCKEGINYGRKKFCSIRPVGKPFNKWKKKFLNFKKKCGYFFKTISDIHKFS